MLTQLKNDYNNVFPVKQCSLCPDVNNLNSLLFNDIDYPLSFRAIHQNIRSHYKNFDEFIILLQSLKTKIHCIVLTEAWLNNDYEPEHIPGYNMFRSFDSLNQSDGIVVYLDSSLSATCNQLTLAGLATALCLTFDWDGQPCELLAVYRSPSSSLVRFVDAIGEYYQNNKNSYHYRFFTGDINCNILSPSLNSVEEKYLDTLYDAGFVPCVDLITRPDSNTCIDHFFVNLAKFALVTPVVLQTQITDHYAILVQISKSGSNLNKSNATFYNKIDWKDIESQLENRNWQEILDCPHLDECTEKFTNEISIIFNSATKQIKSCAKNRKLKPWITSGLLTSIRYRDSLFKKLKKEPYNVRLRARYTNYRNMLNSLVKQTKIDYYKSKIDEAAGDARKFWSVVNEVSGRPTQASGFPVEGFCVGGGSATPSEIKGISQDFNLFFSNVGSSLAQAITTNGPPEVVDADYASNSVFALEPVTREQLIDAIKQLKGGSAPGCDGIPAKLIKDFSQHLILPLLHIINLSICSGEFPESFKLAKVIPIHKGGSKSLMNNFRPISLLTVIDKLLEKCVKIQLNNYLTIENIISNNQYGFKKGKSTSDALFDITKTIQCKTSENCKVMITFLDLAKAFDSVDRAKLLKKLELIGITGRSLHWFRQYFDQRKQFVVINGINSDTINVDYGVVQGSTLGPLLFLIYINNISKLCLHGQLFLFADDTALVSYGRDWNEVYARAASDLAKVKNWFDHNVLTVNVDKTKCLPIYFRSDSGPGQRVLKIHSCGDLQSSDCGCGVIEQVAQYKYLGVIVDHKLSWEPHVHHIKQRLRRMVYAFRRLNQVLTVDRCRSVYYAYVQSVLQYGLLAWGGASASVLEPLAVTQRSIIKTILFKNPRYPSHLLYQDFSVLNIRQLYIKTLLIYIKVNKNIFTPTTHNYDTRNKLNLGISIPKLKFRADLSNPFYVAHQLYRNLPIMIKNAEGSSVAAYRRELERWLLGMGADAAEMLIHSPYA
jgi:hypothetical protein